MRLRTALCLALAVAATVVATLAADPVPTSDSGRANGLYTAVITVEDGHSHRDGALPQIGAAALADPLPWDCPDLGTAAR